jgi:hypothetical protein
MESKAQVYARRKKNIIREKMESGMMGLDSVCTIILDPSPEYGFAAGSVINCLPEMLHENSFTPNTILRNSGKVWKVVEEWGRQRLVEVEA